ncbi:MAG: glycosyltransferase [Planctomycetaceae bacterium]
MSPIKVVFSIGSLHGGGAERQIVSLVRHLDRRRVQPLLYLVYRSGTLLSEVPDDVPVAAFDERYRGSGRPGFLMHGRRVADMTAFLKECRADVSYDRTFLMTLIAAAAAQRADVPNVSSIVTDPSLGFAPVAGRHQWLKKRLLRRLYCRSACVLANSDGAARSAERFYGLPSGLVTTLHNGVDLQHIRQQAAVPVNNVWWNRPSAPGRRRFRIVTAGRLGPQKGFHLLIEAVRQLSDADPNTEFRLAVLGEGRFHDSLGAQIRDSGLSQVVLLTGFQTDAAAWYRQADLFVLPSFLEGMPNVLLEAMACGTPVLSTDCPSGPREILEDGRCGELCEVGSVPALVRGIQKFAADDDCGRRYTSFATPRVEQQFSIQTAARKLEDILVAAATMRRSGDRIRRRRLGGSGSGCEPFDSGGQ